MRDPLASLNAIAAAASLVHERAAVRKGRVAALGVVDLSSSGSCADCGIENQGVSVARHGRCLQVLSTVPILTMCYLDFFRFAGDT